METDHERIIQNNVPSAEQLHRLASIGMGSAASRQRLKQLWRTKRAHFFIEEMDLMGPLTFEDEPSQIRHRMSGRVGVRDASEGLPKTWSLKYFDTYWVEHQPGQWLGERTLYKFEWSRSRTLMAKRSFHLVGIDRPDERDLGDEIDYFSIKDDAPDIWHAQQEVETVTNDDCDVLIRSSADYFKTIDSLYGQAVKY